MAFGEGIKKMLNTSNTVKAILKKVIDVSCGNKFTVALISIQKMNAHSRSFCNFQEFTNRTLTKKFRTMKSIIISKSLSPEKKDIGREFFKEKNNEKGFQKYIEEADTAYVTPADTFQKLVKKERISEEEIRKILYRNQEFSTALDYAERLQRIRNETKSKKNPPESNPSDNLLEIHNRPIFTRVTVDSQRPSGRMFQIYRKMEIENDKERVKKTHIKKEFYDTIKNVFPTMRKGSLTNENVFNPVSLVYDDVSSLIIKREEERIMIMQNALSLIEKGKEIRNESMRVLEEDSIKSSDKKEGGSKQVSPGKRRAISTKAKPSEPNTTVKITKPMLRRRSSLLEEPERFNFSLNSLTASPSKDSANFLKIVSEKVIKDDFASNLSVEGKARRGSLNPLYRTKENNQKIQLIPSDSNINEMRRVSNVSSEEPNKELAKQRNTSFENRLVLAEAAITKSNKEIKYPELKLQGKPHLEDANISYREKYSKLYSESWGNDKLFPKDETITAEGQKTSSEIRPSSRKGRSSEFLGHLLMIHQRKNILLELDSVREIGSNRYSVQEGLLTNESDEIEGRRSFTRNNEEKRERLMEDIIRRRETVLAERKNLREFKIKSAKTKKKSMFEERRGKLMMMIDNKGNYDRTLERKRKINMDFKYSCFVLLNIKSIFRLLFSLLKNKAEFQQKRRDITRQVKIVQKLYRNYKARQTIKLLSRKVLRLWRWLLIRKYINNKVYKKKGSTRLILTKLTTRGIMNKIRTKLILVRNCVIIAQRIFRKVLRVRDDHKLLLIKLWDNHILGLSRISDDDKVIVKLLGHVSNNQANDSSSQSLRRKMENNVSEFVRYLQDRKTNLSKKKIEKFELVSSPVKDVEEEYSNTKKGLSKMALLLNTLKFKVSQQTSDTHGHDSTPVDAMKRMHRESTFDSIDARKSMRNSQLFLFKSNARASQVTASPKKKFDFVNYGSFVEAVNSRMKKYDFDKTTSLLPFSEHNHYLILPPQYTIKNEIPIIHDSLIDDFIKLEKKCKRKYIVAIYNEIRKDKREKNKEFHRKLHEFKEKNKDLINLERTRMLLKTSIIDLEKITLKEENELKMAHLALINSKLKNDKIQKMIENKDHLPFADMKEKIALTLPGAPVKENLIITISFEKFKANFEKYLEDMRKIYARLVSLKKDKLSNAKSKKKRRFSIIEGLFLKFLRIFPEYMNKIIGALAKGTVANKIADKVNTRFKPTFLEIINESHKHKVPKDSETHFKIVVVSQEFDGLKTLVEKQRLVYTCLEDELKNKVHALSITCRTPEEWDKSQEVPKTPPCKSSKEKLEI